MPFLETKPASFLYSSSSSLLCYCLFVPDETEPFLFSHLINIQVVLFLVGKPNMVTKISWKLGFYARQENPEKVYGGPLTLYCGIMSNVYTDWYWELDEYDYVSSSITVEQQPGFQSISY